MKRKILKFHMLQLVLLGTVLGISAMESNKGLTTVIRKDRIAEKDVLEPFVKRLGIIQTTTTTAVGLHATGTMNLIIGVMSAKKDVLTNVEGLVIVSKTKVPLLISLLLVEISKTQVYQVAIVYFMEGAQTMIPRHMILKDIAIKANLIVRVLAPGNIVSLKEIANRPIRGIILTPQKSVLEVFALIMDNAKALTQITMILLAIAI